jgi:hypothetical protein
MALNILVRMMRSDSVEGTSCDITNPPNIPHLDGTRSRVTSLLEKHFDYNHRFLKLESIFISHVILLSFGLISFVAPFYTAGVKNEFILTPDLFMIFPKQNWKTVGVNPAR